MALAYTVKITDRLLRFDTTHADVVVTLLPFAQTPNAPYEIHKISTGDGHTVLIQVHSGNGDFLVPGGGTNITLDDVDNAVTIRIPAGGLSPAFVTWGSGGGAGTSSAAISYGTHASRPDPTTVSDSALYVETDRSEVVYQAQAGKWHYCAGRMWGTISPDQRPTDLGVNDAGFDYHTTDEPPREFIWSGTAWVEVTPGGGAAVPSILYGKHVSRPTAGSVPDATLYVETDRGEVIYQSQAPGVWLFLSGTMWGTMSPDNRPADLGVYDAGFAYRTTDLPARSFVWSGTAWVETTSASMVLNGTHAARPAVASVPNAAIYVETDRGVMYQNWAGIWHYIDGTMWGSLSPDQRPTDLGVSDGGFQYRSTDADPLLAPRTFTWSQTEWVETTGVLYGPHAARPAANETTPSRTIYVETDRNGVIYQQQWNAWHFLAGTMWNTISPDNRPTDLGLLDAGFTYRTTDPPPRSWVWSGTAWVETTPNSSAQAQTPWLSDIDGNQHNLSNVASIAINRTSGNSVLSITSTATDAPFIDYVRGPQTWWVGPGIEANADFVFYNQTAGVPVMIVAANGNVGIGTTPPATELHVSSAAGATQVTSECTSGGYAQFRVKSDTNAYQLSVGGSADGVYSGHCYIFDEAASAARIMITPSGNVGIGINAPQSIFHVSYAGGYPNGPVFTGSVQSCMEFSAASGAPNSGFAIGRSAVGNDNQDFFIYDGVAGAFRFNITSAGKVGIGNQAPNFQLNVHNADTYVAVMVTGSDPGAVGIGSYQGAGFIQAYPDNTASALAPLALQGSGGNVGIGTYSARATLDIIVPSQASTVSDGGGGGLRLAVSAAQGATGLYFGVDDANYAWLACIAPGVGRYPIALNPGGGNVGIGTSAPTTQLSLIPATNPTTLAAAQSFSIGENSNNPAFRLSLGYWANPASWWESAIQSTVNGAGGPLLLNPAGGFVGVNITVPLAQLSVCGTTPDPTASMISTTSLAGAVEILDTGTSVGSGGEIVFSAYSGNWRMCAIKAYAVNGSGNSQGNLVFYTRHAATDAGLDESMRISADGSVQINNTLTVGGLVVSGSMTFGNTTVNGQLAVRNDLASVTSIGNAQLAVGSQADTTKNLWIGFDPSANEGFLQAGISGVSWNNLLINPIAGNVGIGTTAPTHTLDVTGNFNCTAGANVGGVLNVGAGTGGQPGDIGVARVNVPTAGAIYFGNTGSNYIYFDGTAFNFSQFVNVNASQLSIVGSSPVLALSGQEASGKLITLGENAGVVDLDWYANAALMRFNANNGCVTMGWSGLGGNLGIQTNSPIYPLDFGATLGNKIALYNNPFYGFAIQSGVIQYMSGASHQFLSNGITSLYITPGGFVGVGTPAPNELLSVIPYTNRNSLATANQIATGEASNNTGYRLKMGYYNNPGNSACQSAIQSIAGNAAAPLVLNPSGGNVGIGTETPGFPLDVWTSGSVALRLVSLNSANNNCQMRFYGGKTGQELWDIGTDIANANGDKAFMFFDALASKVPLYLQQGTGNVGIGVIPTAMLDVNGVMRCVGSVAPATGVGVEITYASGGGFIQSYDRGAAAYHPLLIGASSLELYGGNVGVGLANATHLFQLNADDAAKPSTSTWTVASGSAVKQNVKDLEGGLDIINRIRPVEAEYNGEHKTPKGRRVVSIIAEEIREVLPNTVTEDSEGVLGFNPHEIIFQLILAVKQLSRKVDEMEATRGKPAN